MLVRPTGADVLPADKHRHTHARTHIHRAEDRKVKKKGKECVKLAKCCVFEGINSVPAGQHSRDDQAEHLQGHDGTGIRRRRQVG